MDPWSFGRNDPDSNQETNYLSIILLTGRFLENLEESSNDETASRFSSYMGAGDRRAFKMPYLQKTTLLIGQVYRWYSWMDKLSNVCDLKVQLKFVSINSGDLAATRMRFNGSIGGCLCSICEISTFNSGLDGS